MSDSIECKYAESKKNIYNRFVMDARDRIESQKSRRMNAIWLEATGCSGNILSFLNGENPNIGYTLTNLIDLKYNNTIMAAEGERAYEKFLDTLNTEFILLVEGAIALKDNGLCNIIANYKGQSITSLNAVKMASQKAKYILTVGTCASYGGISAARPNPTECRSVYEIIKKPVIRLPGCPSHPDWVVGTIAHLIAYGSPELDNEGRPLIFYGYTIHDNCTRRGFFDKGFFAQKYGDPGCMFKVGCRGPVTKTDCPRRKWNGYVNWPVGDNTTCIGCAQQFFPDGMEPFVRF